MKGASDLRAGCDVCSLDFTWPIEACLPDSAAAAAGETEGNITHFVPEEGLSRPRRRAQ